MPLLDTGFRIVCALSIILAVFALTGASWLCYTRLGSTPDKFNATATGTTTAGPESLTRQKQKHGQHQPQFHAGGEKRTQNYENQYQNMKHALLHDWEHDVKPILLTCCVVTCICACLQGIGSFFGCLACIQVKTKVKLWLILHFLLFFAYVLCMLTMFISNMHRKPTQKWSVKVYRLQGAAERVSDDAREGDQTTQTHGHDAEVQAIGQFIKFSASFFYIIVTINASLTLLLFFTAIWLMKEDREYKYQQVGTGIFK